MNKNILEGFNNFIYYGRKIKMGILKCIKYRSYKLEKELLKKNNIPYFSLKDLHFKAKISNINNITDFDISFSYQKKLIKFPARLLNVKYDKTYPLNLDKFLVSNQLVYVIADDFDLDGKLLVTLYNNKQQYLLKDISINERILLKNSISGKIDDLDPFFAIEL